MVGRSEKQPKYTRNFTNNLFNLTLNLLVNFAKFKIVPVLTHQQLITQTASAEDQVLPRTPMSHSSQLLLIPAALSFWIPKAPALILYTCCLLSPDKIHSFS